MTTMTHSEQTSKVYRETEQRIAAKRQADPSLSFMEAFNEVQLERAGLRPTPPAAPMKANSAIIPQTGFIAEGMRQQQAKASTASESTVSKYNETTTRLVDGLTKLAAAEYGLDAKRDKGEIMLKLANGDGKSGQTYRETYNRTAAINNAPDEGN